MLSTRPVNPDGHALIDSFFRSVDPWVAAYKYRTFSYFGVHAGSAVEVYAARLRLSATKPPDDFDFKAGPYAAGRILLDERSEPSIDLTKVLVSGNSLLLSRARSFVLPADDHAGIWIPPPDPLHSDGISSGRRLAVLSVFGAGVRARVDQPQADWILRSATEPYDGVSELLTAIELGAQLGDRCRFEVIAHTIVEVLATSKVESDTAHMGLWIARSLDPAHARLGYRILHKGIVVSRGTVQGSKMKWHTKGPARMGVTKIDVPRGAIVNCVAIYADVAHHSTWIADQREFSNPRLAAFETVDAGLETLKAYLLPASVKGSAARQFETAVAWVLWSYGLSVAQMDSADQSKEGPDILAVAPGGGIAVVECTTGILKTSNKLAHIARRAVAVREKLDSTVQDFPVGDRLIS